MFLRRDPDLLAAPGGDDRRRGLPSTMNVNGNNYPGIFRVTDAPGVSSSHLSHLRRVSDEVCRRTGLHCSFRAANRSLLFHSGPEPFGGPLAIEMYRPDGTERKLSDIDIDDAVRFVGYCRNKAQKDRTAQNNAQIEKWQRTEAREKYLADIRPDAKDYAGWRDRARRGTGKLVSA